MIIYVLVIALALSAGLMLGVRVRGPLRWAGTTAAFLILAVVVTGIFALGTEAPWAGPIFAIVASITAVLVAAEARREDPAFSGEPYGQRVLLVLSPRYSRSESTAGERHNAS